jgi:hypothetical protein
VLKLVNLSFWEKTSTISAIIHANPDRLSAIPMTHQTIFTLDLLSDPSNREDHDTAKVKNPVP